MKSNHLKNDLVKLLILNLSLVVILVALAIWDKSSNILVKIAEDWIK